MRIAVVNWSRRRVGGTEAYLENIIPRMSEAGHRLSFWHELDTPADRERIDLPGEMPSWCVAELGARRALERLAEWKPDVIYSHSLIDPDLESEVLRIAPAVFFAHAYYGTCISGDKTFKTPVATPCDQRFGRGCFLNYYPRRCGGLSPLTMVREYRRQSKRLGLLSTYRAIITHSEHMRAEYVRHGVEPGKVFHLSYYALGGPPQPPQDCDASSFADSSSTPENARGGEHVSAGHALRYPAWRILFLGRMEFLKGGHLLLDALPRVCAELDRPVRVTFAGDGQQRAAWERQAARVLRGCGDLSIEFAGWVVGKEREALWNDCDLLVVPSVWPEPFGLVGPEAGLHSVPVVAFGVGGIGEWLKEGLNGHLAAANPPTSEGLARAIVKTLSDPKGHTRLRRMALVMAREFNVENHLTGLLRVFEGARRGVQAAGGATRTGRRR